MTGHYSDASRWVRERGACPHRLHIATVPVPITCRLYAGHSGDHRGWATVNGETYPGSESVWGSWR